jgi:hypothetical protein
MKEVHMPHKLLLSFWTIVTLFTLAANGNAQDTLQPYAIPILRTSANSMRVLAAVVLILSASAPNLTNVSAQGNNQKLSVKEEQEVREFVKQVAADIEKTRDLTRYLTKPPASKFFYKAIADPNDPVGIVDKNVARKVGSHDLRRFYIVLWNIAYLSESYIFSKFLLEKTPVRDLLPQQQYPAHVVRFLEQNPSVKKWWKNVASSDSEEQITTVVQFYSILNAYRDAIVLMRAYFKRHPPERRAIYKQNLTHLGSFLNEITVDTCESEQDCAGLPLGTQTIRANLPVLQLSLVRLNGRLQVLFIGLHND